MKLLIKICGLTTAAAVEAVAAAGADAAGFVFAASPRQVTPAQAAELAAILPPDILRVAVFRRIDPGLLAEVLAALSPQRIQGDAHSFAGVTLPAGCRPWPVLREGTAMPDPLPEEFVYEGALSGRGTTVDWNKAAIAARRARMILAGGLNASNVALAVARVAPAGVDVSSGVETSPGVKSVQRIRAFVYAARGSRPAGRRGKDP